MAGSKKRTKLADLYLGEDVVITLKMSNVNILDPSSGSVYRTQQVQGVVVDIDDSFIHLGSNQGDILKSVDISDIGVIELNVEIPPELLAEMPTNDKDIH